MPSENSATTVTTPRSLRHILPKRVVVFFFKNEAEIYRRGVWPHTELAELKYGVTVAPNPKNPRESYLSPLALIDNDLIMFPKISKINSPIPSCSQIRFVMENEMDECFEMLFRRINHSGLERALEKIVEHMTAPWNEEDGI